MAGHAGVGDCRMADWRAESALAAHRLLGFLVSNLLWIAWGIHDGAYALVALQLTLGVLNVRGLFKTDS